MCRHVREGEARAYGRGPGDYGKGHCRECTIKRYPVKVRGPAIVTVRRNFLPRRVLDAQRVLKKDDEASMVGTFQPSNFLFLPWLFVLLGLTWRQALPILLEEARLHAINDLSTFRPNKYMALK